MQDVGETAKWFFSGLWGNLKWSFSNAQKVIDEANSPVEIQPQAEQPVAPQAEQPAAPQQPTEVQPGDIQQPTQTPTA